MLKKIFLLLYSSYRLGDIQKYIINKQYIVYDLIGNCYNSLS